MTQKRSQRLGLGGGRSKEASLRFRGFPAIPVTWIIIGQMTASELTIV